MSSNFCTDSKLISYRWDRLGKLPALLNLGQDKKLEMLDQFQRPVGKQFQDHCTKRKAVVKVSTDQDKYQVKEMQRTLGSFLQL